MILVEKKKFPGGDTFKALIEPLRTNIKIKFPSVSSIFSTSYLYQCVYLFFFFMNSNRWGWLGQINYCRSPFAVILFLSITERWLGFSTKTGDRAHIFLFFFV